MGRFEGSLWLKIEGRRAPVEIPDPMPGCTASVPVGVERAFLGARG
jgi:hypothetical protein